MRHSSLRFACLPALATALLIFSGSGVRAEEQRAAPAPIDTRVSVYRTPDGWNIVTPAATGPAAPPVTVSVDGKPLTATGTNTYHIAKLAQGVHPVAVAGAGPATLLLIRESGRSPPPPTLSSPRVFAFPIALDDPHQPAVTVRVTQNDLLELQWSSTAPVEIHLHGYDIEGKVAPAAPLAMVFEANIAGHFSVETHQKSGHRTLAFIDVYPP
jgi:hypothetical protein